MLRFPHGSPVNEAEFRNLAAQRLLSAPTIDTRSPAERSSGPSDFDLNPDLRAMALPQLRAAAVLVPIVLDDTLSVLLTLRTNHLAAHAGQIAFPGGKLEQQETPLAAALREAHEEIGLEPQFVEPLGYIEPYETSTGFHVTPVVSFVRPGFTLKADPEEVAEIFTVPLTFLLDQSNHRIDAREFRGAMRHFYAIPYEGRYIWGATAGIIRALHRRLSAI